MQFYFGRRDSPGCRAGCREGSRDLIPLFLFAESARKQKVPPVYVVPSSESSESVAVIEESPPSSAPQGSQQEGYGMHT
jgi:hypothetical protein